VPVEYAGEDHQGQSSPGSRSPITRSAFRRGTGVRSVRAGFQLYERAVEAGLVELAPRTKVTVRSAAKTMSSMLLPDGREFGDVRLSRLTWQDIEEMYAAMRPTGRGADWIRRCATVLNRSLELARKRGLLDANPSKDAARPRSTRSKPFAPTSEEVRALLAASRQRDPETADLVTVVASTGMRVGELLALRWVDVDLAAGELHVAAAITDGGPGVGVIRKTTNRSDWRDVPLTGAAAKALRSQATGRRELIGVEPGPESYVFAASIDGFVPLRPDSLGDRWASARGTSAVTLQHLRHYAATAMLDAGSHTGPSPTSLATASRRSGCTTTVVPTSASARPLPRWNWPSRAVLPAESVGAGQAPEEGCRAGASICRGGGLDSDASGERSSVG
jgi:integrase